MLNVIVSQYTATGLREANEDFAGAVIPSAHELYKKGVLAVIADGVSGANGGREAAEYCCRNVLTDYFSTPEAWEISQALERIYRSLNKWVLDRGRSNHDLAGMATTLTSLVLHGAHYFFSHVGDTRLYLFRDGQLSCLTTDHVWHKPEMSHVLTRAIGLDTNLAIDHGMGALRPGDLFILMSDGIWSATPDRDLLAAVTDKGLSSQDGLENLTRMLCEQALLLGSRDNCTAVALKVVEIGEDSLQSHLLSRTSLPVPALDIGSEIDGLTVREVLQQSRSRTVFLVTDGSRKLILKTLAAGVADDASERSALLHESWLNKKVAAKFFPQHVAPLCEPSALYELTTWHPGRDLAGLLESGRHFTIPEIIQIGTQLCKALGALHRRRIIHRDIKPDNILLDEAGNVTLLDLGVALAEGSGPETIGSKRAGTPSYLAPELFRDGAPSPASDLYSWGVTIYRLLTRHYPYGEIEAFQTPRFGQLVPASRYRPELPGWLDNLLTKALAVDSAQRFETAEELLMALERGPWKSDEKQVRVPLASRNRIRTWQVLAVVSFLLNLVLLYLLSGR